MAELAIRARYRVQAYELAMSILRLGFPVWGLIMPIAGVIMLLGLITSFTSLGVNFGSWTSAQLIAYCSGLVACFALPAMALLSSNLLSNDSVIADRSGLHLPLSARLLWWRGYLPWNSIRKVLLRGEPGGPWKMRSLAFLTDTGVAIELPLARFNPEELEPLLLAIDMWAKESDRDPEVKDLAESLSAGSIESLPQGAKYTDMWEDELRRRFSSTVFLPLEQGQILRSGSLRVVRPLAIGGFSAIYLCQLDERKLVVLKEAVVPADSTVHLAEKAKELFEREARLLMKLQHPNIVRVLDYFVDGGRSYLMLEYANGQDMRQLVKQNGVQPETVLLEWAGVMANILKYLHEQDPPIIHRDLTPENLVVRSDGSIVLIDFGAANEFLSKATGTFVGKQAYIAPEQFRGKAVVQSDIYSLGCTLHFALTGEDPEALSTSYPRLHNPSVSEDLNEVIASCTQMEVSDRFQSAAQLLPVLRRIAAVQGAV